MKAGLQGWQHYSELALDRSSDGCFLKSWKQQLMSGFLPSSGCFCIIRNILVFLQYNLTFYSAVKSKVKKMQKEM